MHSLRAAMRVLHLTRDLPPEGKGGISAAVGGLVRAAAGAGCPTAVVSFDGWRPKRRPRGRTQRSTEGGPVPVLRLTDPSQLDALLPFAARFGPTVMQVHHGMLWEHAEALRSALRVPALLFTHVVQRRLSLVRGVTEPTLSLQAQERALKAADGLAVSSSQSAW